MGILDLVVGLMEYVAPKPEEGLPGEREHTHALRYEGSSHRGEGMLFGPRFDYRYSCVIPGCESRVTTSQRGEIPSRVGKWRHATAVDLDTYLAHEDAEEQDLNRVVVP